MHDLCSVCCCASVPHAQPAAVALVCRIHAQCRSQVRLGRQVGKGRWEKRLDREIDTVRWGVSSWICGV